MRSFVSLNKNRDFIRAYKKGRSAVTPCIALYSMKNRQQTNRIGITASKRIGRAVQRNRAKRIIREALMMLKPQLKPGYDLVVVARSRTPYRKTQDVYADLRQAALRQHLLLDTQEDAGAPSQDNAT